MPAQMASLITTPSTPAISSTVGLAISSSLNSSKTALSIVVKCRSAQAISGTKFVVYVLENGVISPLHINSFSGDATFGNPSGILYPLFTAPNPILNYVNNNVVRASVTNLFGDPIPDQVAAFEYTKTYTVNLTPTWNSNNLSIVFMAVRFDNSLRNAQAAAVGQLQDFQIIVP